MRFGFKRLFFSVLAVCWLLSFSRGLLSHPHVFIDNKTTCIFKNNSFKGFSVGWEFDGMFSSSILLDYDRNNDKDFSQSEIDTIRAEAFSNLKNFNYFYHIRINGEKFKITKIDSFDVEYESEKLIYKFFIPCYVEASNETNKITFAVYDESYFVDLNIDKENGVSFISDNHVEFDFFIEDKVFDDGMYGKLRRTVITIIFENTD